MWGQISPGRDPDWTIQSPLPRNWAFGGRGRQLSRVLRRKWGAGASPSPVLGSDQGSELGPGSPGCRRQAQGLVTRQDPVSPSSFCVCLPAPPAASLGIPRTQPSHRPPWPSPCLIRLCTLLVPPAPSLGCAVSAEDPPLLKGTPPLSRAGLRPVGRVQDASFQAAAWATGAREPPTRLAGLPAPGRPWHAPSRQPCGRERGVPRTPGLWALPGSPGHTLLPLNLSLRTGLRVLMGEKSVHTAGLPGS